MRGACSNLGVPYSFEKGPDYDARQQASPKKRHTHLFLQLAFDCSYRFERDTRMWKPSTAQALIGDAALRALLNSIGKNQVHGPCNYGAVSAVI